MKFGLARLAMAFTPSAGALDVARDVRPWLGDEAAVALLAGAGRPQPLLVAAVRDRERAEAMLERLGAAPSGRHNGAALLRLPPPAFAAFAGDHLVIGPEAAVRVPSTAPPTRVRPPSPTAASSGAPPRSASRPRASTR